MKDDRPVQDPQDGRPSHYQVAWVFRHLLNHLQRPGSYRYLIYDRMGFDETAYHTRYEAGGMALSNAANDLAERDQLKAEVERLREALDEINTLSLTLGNWTTGYLMAKIARAARAGEGK